MPSPIDQLVSAQTDTTREAAWDALVAEQTRLLMHVARSVAAQHDGAMDAYTFVLERLREDEFRRLRGYADDGRSRFSTWLAVVARRLCLDYYRQRYGRPRGDLNGSATAARQAARRRLMDFVAHDIAAVDLAAIDTDAPDVALRLRERNDALDAAFQALSAEDQVLLRLRFHDGLTGQEIASTLGLPTPFHVFRRLNATYDQLRRALQSRGVEDSVP